MVEPDYLNRKEMLAALNAQQQAADEATRKALSDKVSRLQAETDAAERK